ncbi:MAG: nuclear transport factor 2 family protein [Cyanobacteria bacterium]|nr:nuclear transport factor 2 family protein [Cyanobacteriota bacterium]
MSNALDLVKKAYAAWESKDKNVLKEVLHPDYKADIPGGMEMVGIQCALDSLDDCPVDGHSENESYVVDGDRIVRIWDWVATSPVTFRVRMAELSVVKDGKVVYNEAFFDTSAFPKEMQEPCEEMKAKYQKKETATASGGKK